MPHSRKVFVNTTVRDLKRSMEFFSKLGFEFNKQFTDDKAACMVISEHAFVMLLSEPFFKTFTSMEICNTATHVESIIAVDCESREAVDLFLKKALDAGGTKAAPPNDYGFMYNVSFKDLDGHHWEAFWMDPKGPPAQG